QGQFWLSGGVKIRRLVGVFACGFETANDLDVAQTLRHGHSHRDTRFDGDDCLADAQINVAEHVLAQGFAIEIQFDLARATFDVDPGRVGVEQAAGDHFARACLELDLLGALRVATIKADGGLACADVDDRGSQRHAAQCQHSFRYAFRHAQFVSVACTEFEIPLVFHVAPDRPERPALPLLDQDFAAFDADFRLPFRDVI